MKQLLLFTLAFILTGLNMSAQSSDPTLFSVNGKPVYKSEFEASYKKNNSGEGLDKTDLSSFLQSYIDSKLSVEEALSQHLDTTTSFRYQYNSYKLQIIDSYLNDKVFYNQYFENMYHSYLQDVELNHVLIPFKNNEILTADTVEAYREAMAQYDKLRKNGFKGDDLVDRTKIPSITKQVETISGYLGWVTAPMLSAILAKAVFVMPVGEISKPIRTSRGYHIIQVINKRPAIGYRTVDQVIFGYPNLPPTKNDIDSVLEVAQSVYSEIENEADFQSLCDVFAEVHRRKDKGCRFGEISLGSQLPPPFIAAAFELQNVGDITEPVVSDYGVHILRLVAKRGMPAEEKMMHVMIEDMGKSDRSAYYTFDYQQNFFQKYGLSFNDKAYAQLNNIANSIYPTDSTFVSHIKNGNDILFVVDDTLKYTVEDFANYLSKLSVHPEISEEDVIAQAFGLRSIDPFNLSTDKLRSELSQFAAVRLRDYLLESMDRKNSDIKTLVDEYAEGILIFDVKKKNIWSQSQNENALEQFFKKNKSKYKWDSPRYKGSIVFCDDKKTLDIINQAVKKKKKNDDLETFIFNRFQGDSILNHITIDNGLWSKGQNEYIDYKVFSGENPAKENEHPYYLVVGTLIKAAEESDDVKGEVIADYQDQIEKDWLVGLRKKYNVVVDQSVLKSIEYDK